MKNNSVQNMSQQEIISAIEENFTGFFRACVQIGQGDIYEEPELTWIFTGTPLTLFNGVFHTSLTLSDPEVTIEKVLNFYQSRQQSMVWCVSPLTHPSDLSHRLTAHGLTPWRTVGMAIDLHKINESLPFPEGLVIERVQNEQTMREWVCTMARGFPMDEAGSLKLMANVPPLEHPAGPFYLARLNGEPVATSALYCAEEVAGIYYMVCTGPSARQQGIRSAMTMTSLLDARAMGYRMAILQATPIGQPIYQRLGFTSYYTLDRYCWEPSN
ncbi:MAG TPA: GNAT family N-acetyltransferase [Ktedonobacteraceae bacterium]